MCQTNRAKKLVSEFEPRGPSNSKQTSVATQLSLDTNDNIPQTELSSQQEPIPNIIPRNELSSLEPIHDKTNEGSNEPEESETDDDDMPVAYLSSKKLFQNVDDRPHAKVSVNENEHTLARK